MTRLSNRLTALEAMFPANDYSRLSDEQVSERLVQVCERIERAVPSGNDWRGMVERGDLAALGIAAKQQAARIRAMEDTPCGR